MPWPSYRGFPYRDGPRRMNVKINTWDCSRRGQVLKRADFRVKSCLNHDPPGFVVSTFQGMRKSSPNQRNSNSSANRPLNRTQWSLLFLIDASNCVLFTLSAKTIETRQKNKNCERSALVFVGCVVKTNRLWPHSSPENSFEKNTSHHITSQHSTAHHSTTQHNTSQHNTSHHITSHHSTAHHITTHHITSHHSTAQHITAQHNTSHHTTAQHSTTHHSTTQHNTSHHITSHHTTSHHTHTHTHTHTLEALTTMF